jgi:hypothetical protein
MMDAPGSLVLATLSVAALRTTTAARDDNRKRTRRTVAEPRLAVALLSMLAAVPGLPPQMKSRRRKMSTARPRMKAV